jgi:hypothetical protein
MRFSGVTGNYQVSVVQSIQSFAPPFYMVAGVLASASFGNAASLAIMSADGTEGTGIFGNIGPNWAYGINYVLPLLNHTLGGTGTIYASPQLNTSYDYNISADSGGSATLGVSSNGGSLGFVPDLSVGMGPFYVLIIEFEGFPNTSGSDFVNWSCASAGPW